MRPDYREGAQLNARDLNDEQDDRIHWIRRHSRFAHGSGRVCGLQVYAAPDHLRPWRIGICPGYAVNPCGDEIEVPSRTFVDIRDFAWSRPHTAGGSARIAFVALRFTSTLEEAGEKAGCNCCCGCSTCSAEDAGRLRDGYAVDILWQAEVTATPRVDLCSPGSVPCPLPPASAHVILAAVRLPALENTPLEDGNILEL